MKTINLILFLILLVIGVAGNSSAFSVSHLNIGYFEPAFGDPRYIINIWGPKPDNFDYVLLKNPLGITLLDSREDTLFDLDDETWVLWNPAMGDSTPPATGYYIAEFWLNGTPEVHTIDFEVKLENIPYTAPVILNPTQSSTVIAPPFTMSWEKFDLLEGENYVSYNFSLSKPGEAPIFHENMFDDGRDIFSYTYYDPIEAGNYSVTVYALADTIIQNTDSDFGFTRWGGSEVNFNIAPVSDTIVIDGCDTGVAEQVYEEKLISQWINECATTAKNHGKFVSCVSKLTNGLKSEGVITGKEKGAIQSCAAQAHIP